MRQKFNAYIIALQDEITTALEKIDGWAVFIEDIWKSPEGGGGKTRVIPFKH